MRDLRSAAFLNPLPDFLATPTDENASKVVAFVAQELDGQPLAQRQLLSLARRLYPLESRGFQILEQFDASHGRFGRTPLKPVRTEGYVLKPLDTAATSVRRDWYVSEHAYRLYAVWYEGYHFDDLSFQIVDTHGHLLLTVPCTIFRDGAMSYFNQPIVFLAEQQLREGRDQGDLKRALAVALRYIDGLATEYLAYSFVVSAESNEMEEMIHAAVTGRRTFITVRSQPTVALGATNEELFRSIRRSYRSLIRASCRTYATTYYSGHALEQDATQIRECILSLSAAKHSLPPRKLDFCLELCSRDKGEVQIAKGSNGTIAGAHIVVDDGLTTMFAIGAYAGAEQNLPVSHGMMYNALIRAKARGMKTFFLSHIPDPRYDFNGFGIIDAGADREGYKFFKLGFANEVLRWTSFRTMPDELCEPPEQHEHQKTGGDSMIPIYETNNVRVIEMADSDGDTQRLLCLGPAFKPWQGGFKTNRPKFHVHQFSRNLTYGALCVVDGVRNALFLGFGAGIAIQAVRDLFPAANIDIVDTNPELFEVSRKFFFDIDAGNVNLIDTDAYAFIKQSTKRYDYICCDIFAGGLEIPDFLKADEFYADCRGLLGKYGVFSINAPRAEHKSIADILVRTFRYAFSCEGKNATFISADYQLTPVDDVEVKRMLLSNNIDVDAIRDHGVVMRSNGNGSCQARDERDSELETIDDVLSSRSWRITEPLRRTARVLRSLRRRVSDRSKLR